MQVQNAHPKTMPDCAAPGPVRVKKMENRAPVHRRGQVPCLHKFDGTDFLVAVPQWPAHASTHCEEERSGTPVFFCAFHMGIPGKGDSGYGTTRLGTFGQVNAGT